ncbi:MAG: hypothetical protein E7612_02390 [Ruminococcaceae bacterium]|nr:hypothetical protein [Oscillospiraceae bacterium]
MLKTKFKSVFKVTSVVCIAVILVLAMSACSIVDESKQAKELCEKFVGYVIDDEYESASYMTENVGTLDEFKTLWDYMRKALEGSTSFETKQLSWYKNVENGYTYTSVTFEIVTDNDKVCHAEILISDESDGFAGFRFLDSTEFVKSTSYTKYVNIALKAISIALFGITVCAFIDCLRRRIKNKVLWAILILVCVGISITTGSGNFGAHFELSVIFSNLEMTANRLNHTVITTVKLPFGTILYFIMRKRITADDKECESEAALSDEFNTNQVEKEKESEADSEHSYSEDSETKYE